MSEIGEYKCTQSFEIEHDLDGYKLEQPHKIEKGTIWIMDDDGTLKREVESGLWHEIDLDHDYSNFEEVERYEDE